MFKDKYYSMNEEIYPGNQIINKIKSKYKYQCKRSKLKMIFSKPIIIFIVLIICSFTTTPIIAYNVPAFYELIYQISPMSAQFFMPVQESCEDNGIKMEVISTYIHDSTAEIYIALQDLRENRVDETTDLFDSYYIHCPFDTMATCKKVGFDEASKTATFLISITECDNKRITGNKITFSVNKFISGKHEYNHIPVRMDLSDIKESNSKEVSLIGGGGEKYGEYVGSNTETNNAIVSSASMDFPVKGIDFTGIGFVNNMLHVQTSVIDALNNDNHGYFYLRDENENIIESAYSFNFIENTNNGERVDYNEHVFDVSPLEIDKYSLYGTFVTSNLLTEGNWRVTFPIN
ncbi:hypothetical protein [Anaerovorax odorimutans]|uniref:hypothetical protein n=1 Tax=Anaerovorax odorimutans TaxID=109327 RepID=UPI000402DEE4|nr:hypothetical protein [Anaerovorax odorimutans]